MSSLKKVVLEISQNSQENAYARVSFLIKMQGLVILKETLAQVFSSEFCEISENTFSYRTPLVAASVTFMCFHIRRYMKGERYILTFFLDTIDQLTVSLNAKKLVCLFFSYLLIIRSTYLSESF